MSSFCNTLRPCIEIGASRAVWRLCSGTSCCQVLNKGESSMRRSQGRPFSHEEVNRIKFLLNSTDMTLQEIATRMSCAKSSIVSINQTFQIRNYRGRRTYWVLADTGLSGSELQTEVGSLSVLPS